MTRQYFGQPWNAPATDSAVHVSTPVGQPCVHCDEAIVEGDRGFVLPTARQDPDDPAPAGHAPVWVAAAEPTHLECLLRSIVGGAGRAVGRSPREDALATMNWVRRNGRVAP